MMTWGTQAMILMGDEEMDVVWLFDDFGIIFFIFLIVRMNERKIN